VAEKPEFSFSRAFPYTIWKLVAVPAKPVLVLELRDEATRGLEFSALDYEANQFLWEGVKLTESWWVSLFDADESKVYCRKFQNTDNPDEVVWMAMEVTSGNEYTGAAGEIPASFQHASGIHVPSQYPQDQPYFNSVKEFLGVKLNLEPVKAIEYLEYEGNIMISFYTASGKEFENHLVVFDEAGEFRLHETLGTALPGLGLETFFVRDGYLIFVKDKHELVVYSI